MLRQVKAALGWTKTKAVERGDTLARALMEPDDNNCVKELRAAVKVAKESGSSIMQELKLLDRTLKFATGKSLKFFLPKYFNAGVFKMNPTGCRSSWSEQLEPWDARPLLRIVGDRERSQNALQCFLCSRLRAVEVSDPHHILWRVAQLGIEHAGFKNIVAALTVTMNAWKGFLGLTKFACVYGSWLSLPTHCAAPVWGAGREGARGEEWRRGGRGQA